MEIIEIVVGAILVIGGGALAWAWKMQEQISRLKTSVAVNSTKDEQIWDRVTGMETKIDKILTMIGEIKEEAARRKR